MANGRFFGPGMGMVRIGTVDVGDDGRGRSEACAVVTAVGNAALLVERRFIGLSDDRIVGWDGGAIAVALENFLCSDIRVFVKERGIVEDRLEVFGHLERISLFMVIESR